MNNVIMRKVDGTGSFTSLASVKTVCTVTISAPPSNSASVIFAGDDGSQVPWSAGEWHTFRSIDLAAIQAQIAVGDILTIVGGTW